MNDERDTRPRRPPRSTPRPAGRHRVEMRYRAPAARNGAIISVLSLGSLASLALLARRPARRELKS